MKTWQPNVGNPPRRSKKEIAALGFADNPGAAPPITHVHVRLRNGRQPPERWPVKDSRWTQKGDGWDIMEWCEA